MQFLKNPLWTVAAVLVLFVALAFAGGTGGFFAGGGLALAFNGLLALAYGLLALFLTRHLVITTFYKDGKHVDPLDGNTHALGLRVAGMYVFAGLVTHAVFG